MGRGRIRQRTCLSCPQWIAGGETYEVEFKGEQRERLNDRDLVRWWYVWPAGPAECSW